MSDFLTVNLDEKLFLCLSISVRRKRWHVNEMNCISPLYFFNTSISLSLKNLCAVWLKIVRNGNLTGQTCNNLSTAAFKSEYKCITI